jgi:hypothetical protein
MITSGRRFRLNASSAWAIALISTLHTATVLATGPEAHTLRAWQDYVVATEARIEAELSSASGFLVSDFSAGDATTRNGIANGGIAVRKLVSRRSTGASIAVPNGTVAHWQGAVLVPNIMLDSLLERLQHPNEHGPFQQDVVLLRVLSRAPDRLTLALRMTRDSLVRVTYDSEHAVTYQRFGPRRAASRSISTKIVELDAPGTAAERAIPEGDDRGFLWRMNAYSRFEQVGGGVIVEIESLTLSRGIPRGLGIAATPLIDRIARESMTRTLASIRDLYAQATSARRISPDRR